MVEMLLPSEPTFPSFLAGLFHPYFQGLKPSFFRGSLGSKGNSLTANKLRLFFWRSPLKNSSGHEDFDIVTGGS